MYYLKLTLEKLPFGMDNFAGLAIGPVILIKKYHKNNKGLLEHEKFHVRMFWLWYILVLATSTAAGVYFGYIPFPETFQTLFQNEVFYYVLFLSLLPRSFFYKFVEKYRLWEEVKAYKIQEKTNKQNKLKEFAHYIATKYGIDITEEEALRLLKK